MEISDLLTYDGPEGTRYHAEVAERLNDEGLPVGPLLFRLVSGRRRAAQLHVGQAAALLGPGYVYVLHVDAVRLFDPVDDIPVGGFAGDHALVVAVVVQERQDAERAVVQRDHGISKTKVRTPA